MVPKQTELRAEVAPVQRVRELPYVDVPSLTKVVRADRPRPTEKEGPAYITCAPVEQDDLGQEILEEILRAPLDMTIGQILGASPVVRKELGKRITKVRQVPEKDKIEPKRVQFKATVEEVTEEPEEIEFILPHDGISQYFTLPPYSIWIPYGFHMDSIWNANIPWNPHGFHVEYVWFHMEYKKESIWNRNIPWIPYGMEIFYGFHVDSIWNEGLGRI